MKPYDTSDPVVVGKKTTRHKLDSEQQREEFRAVAKTAQGRAVLWRVLSLAGVYRQSYNGDVNYCLFNEGQRKIGLQILEMFNDLGAEGETLFASMQSEAKGRERKLDTDD